MILTLRARLFLGFGLVVALFLVVVAATAYKVESVRDLTSAMKREAELATLAGQWQGDVRQNSARSLAVAHAPGKDMFEFFKDAMAQTSQGTTQTQKAFLALVVDPQARQRAEEVGAVRKEWLAARDAVNALKASGDDQGARAAVVASFVPMTDRYLKVTQALVDGQSDQVHRLEAAVAEAFAALYKLGGALVLCGVVLAALISWRFSRGLGLSLTAAGVAAERIGNGDLAEPVRVERADEIGRLMLALERARLSLAGVVHGVREGVESVGTASAEIAHGNADLSARTEQAASSLQQTASSMEQITGTVKQSADAARQATERAASAASAAQRGGRVVGDVVATMNDIQSSSKRIADIIGTIDGIAFQTNILALNAAVEAARAGEQGRGFAVVAGEVRNLAQRSAEAAREIKSLIGASVERVESGSRLVQGAGATMDEIVASVHRVSQIVAEISLAAGEQSSGIHEVNGAVAQLDQMTQQNAALVEESAAAAQSLSEQATRLAAVVSTFRLDTRALAH